MASGLNNGQKALTKAFKKNGRKLRALTCLNIFCCVFIFGLFITGIRKALRRAQAERYRLEQEHFELYGEWPKTRESKFGRRV